MKERLTNLSEVQNMDLEELKMLKAELSILKAKNEESEAKRSALEHMLISKNAEIASLISAKDQLSQ